MTGLQIDRRRYEAPDPSTLYPDFKSHFPQSCWTLPYVLESQARQRGQRPFLAWADEGRFHSFDEVNRTVPASGLTASAL